MYFKSLTNNELQQFHKLINVRNFSISLTEILSSDLFKKEQINSNNNIYRIYPLFYCKEILTTDTTSKILENKCILTTVGTDEKYFNFITNEDTPVVYDGLDHYTIGDTITTNEYNAFIQLLRKKLTINDNIRATDGTVKGTYADYKFNLADVTIVDNGILITEETLSASPTVRLIDPVFRNSTYTLKLDVFSVSDVNIMDDYNTDNITHDTLEITLEEGTDVSIPLGSLDFNKIVSFNAVIDITHDKPVIQYPGNLELTVETDNYIDTPIQLSVVYEDDTGSPLTREPIRFRDGETVLGTDTTDDDGVATFEYTPTQDKEYNFNAVSEDGLTSNYVVKTIVKHSVNISINTTKTTVFVPSSFTVSGKITSDYGVIENAALKLMNNNTLVTTLYSNSSGEYSHEFTCQSPATYNLQIVYDGNTTHYNKSSSYVNVTARKLNSSITINTNRNSVYHSQSLTISGVLKDENGNPISGATVTLKGGTNDATRTTSSTGAYSFLRNYDSTDYGTTFNYYVVYAGDNSHAGVTSSTKTIPVNKAPTSINSLEDVVNVGDSLPIKVVSSYGTFNPASVNVKLYSIPKYSWETTELLKEETLTTKDSSGNFNFTIPQYASNRFNIVVTYPGDSNYASSSRTEEIYIVEADVNTITISKSGNNVIANFKDSNNANLANTTLSLVDVSFTGGNRASLRSISTDGNGNLTISNATAFGTGCYVVYGDTNSNTLSW